MTSRLIRGCVALEKRLPDGVSLSDQRWIDRLGQIGFDDVALSVRNVIMLENNGSERACAEGVLRALNKGLRNPLRVDFGGAR